MKEEHSTPGFSFLLSASAPPAEVVDRGPGEGASDPLEPSWFGSPSLADPLDPELPTRTPAPVRTLDVEPRAAVSIEDPAEFPGEPSADRHPPAPAVKRISFPKAATTVFSDSVSQVPRVRLESSDDDPLDELSDDPPEDLPLTQGAAPKGRPRPVDPLASALWRQGRRWVVEGGRLTATVARGGARWAMAATQAAGKRTADAWARRRASAPDESAPPPARAAEPSLSGEEVSPVIEGTPKPPSVVAERVRPVLPALAALAAAGACYVAVAKLVPSPADGTNSAAQETTEAAPSDSPGSTDPMGTPPPGSASTPATAKASAAQKSSTPSASAEKPAHTEQLALPDGLGWPGKGLIEVVTAGRELIYVDGVFTGRGPLRRIPVAPGKHEVLLRTESSEQRHAVDVDVDRRTRLLLGDGDGAAPGSERKP